MRAVVCAYHEIGYVCLEELIKSNIEVQALFTHPDDPDEEVWFRTPRSLAAANGIPVFDPPGLKDRVWVERIKAFSPDYLFSFYYRNMLPREVLEIPRLAPLNLHGSLLPRFRGRCPVNWVLIEGETKTGLTLHVMEVKPDAGDIVAQREVAIAFEDTAHSLAVKLAAAARALMAEIMPSLESGTFERRPQEGASSYYGGRKPEDGIIDWKKGADAIYNLIRAVTHPYPGAFTFLDGKRLYIWKALPEKAARQGAPGAIASVHPLVVETGDGTLRILSLQFEDGHEMDADAFAAANNIEKKSLGGVI